MKDQLFHNGGAIIRQRAGPLSNVNDKQATPQRISVNLVWFYLKEKNC